MIGLVFLCVVVFFFQAEDGIRDGHVTGVQTCALPISVERLGQPEPGSDQSFAPESFLPLSSSSSCGVAWIMACRISLLSISRASRENVFSLLPNSRQPLSSREMNPVLNMAAMNWRNSVDRK